VTHSVEEAVALSDRIVMLSARPGRIHRILDVALPRSRSGRLDEAFTGEVVRAREALYAAMEGNASPPQ